MAHWAPKAPTEVVERRWTVPVDYGDALSSVTASASGVTVDSHTTEDSDAVLTLSAGIDGATGSVTITAATSNGLTLVETFYIPIRVSTNAFSYTARDVAYFALRKIVGNGNDPSATELDDATERLSDMVAALAAEGANLGLKLPVAASDILYIPDEHVAALKFNLRVACHDHYEQPISAYDASEARRGLQRIKTSLLPTDRTPADYY